MFLNKYRGHLRHKQEGDLLREPAATTWKADGYHHMRNNIVMVRIYIKKKKKKKQSHHGKRGY
jgi:hypothetical protein